MQQNDIKLKSTIEYKQNKSQFNLAIIFQVILVIVMILLGIGLTLLLPHSYRSWGSIIVLGSLMPLFGTLLNNSRKCYEANKYLKKNISKFETFEVVLNTHTKLKFNRFKYVVKIPIDDEKTIDVISNIYSKKYINNDKMIVGYNKTDSKMIFINNL